MKNGGIDLNNALFAQLERLGDESLEGDKLKEEICRAKSISSVSAQIINNARLELDAKKAVKLGEARELPDLCKPKNVLPGLAQR